MADKKIKITPDLLKGQADELEKLADDYDDLSKRINTALMGINGCWSLMLARNCEGKISSAKKAVDEVASMLHSGSKAAMHSAQSFDEIDASIAKEVDPNYKSSRSVSQGKAITGAAVASFFTSAGVLWNKFTTGQTTGEHSVWKSSNGIFKALTGEASWNGEGLLGFKRKFKPNNEKKTLQPKPIKDFGTKPGQKYYTKDEDGNKKYLPPSKAEFYKKEATLLETGVTAQASGSVFSVGKDWDNGASVGVSVINGEAHAGANAGLYVYKMDKSGKPVRTLAPSASVEVGASVSALEVKGSTPTVGNDMIGGSIDGSVTVGKASAKADAGVGFVKGKLQASASASAEALVAEAKGSVNVNALGGEHKVTGGVNFGVGAHADVGYRDGKFKCDIGASLGVGVSIDVEIDVAGMGKKAVGAAKSAYKWVKNLF